MASQKLAEPKVIEDLRARFEAEGFTFTLHPDRSHLPDFLRSYVPDALAQKPGHNVAIAVKGKRGFSTERPLHEVRRLFEGHPDWHLRVVFTGDDALGSTSLPVETSRTIRTRVEEAYALSARGNRREAFVMAWALLEAALRIIDGEAATPHAPGTLVQALAMNGYIESDVERDLRDLVVLRNRIVHGDLKAEPTQREVELVLSTVQRTLFESAL